MADVVYVNEVKEKRAQRILDMLNGKAGAQLQDELETMERFRSHLADAGVKPDDAKAKQFVYEKLGGLVRTEAEQKAAVEKAKKAKESMRKRRIEGRSEKTK